MGPAPGLQQSALVAAIVSLTHAPMRWKIGRHIDQSSAFGYYIDQMSEPTLTSVLDRQLLLQLGDRLKRLRKARKLGTVEVAQHAGMTRNTLRAIESGDPTPSMGAYLRVMSVLGVSGELALLASGTLNPEPSGAAAERSRRAMPLIQVQVKADDGRHRLQDLQSIALHEEAVRLVKDRPDLLQAAKDTAKRWVASGDPRSAVLWREWLDIMESGAWRKVLARTRHAQQLRQASPLVTALPATVRDDILAQVVRLKHGIALGAEPGPSSSVRPVGEST